MRASIAKSHKYVTPDDPDPYAVKRVRNPLPIPETCPNCGSGVSCVNNQVVYGREFGAWPWIYLCNNGACDSYVGIHPRTNIPLGTLANAETRLARRHTKGVFMKLWVSGEMTRAEAYIWLESAMGVRRGQAHVGWMDYATCRRVLKLLKGRK